MKTTVRSIHLPISTLCLVVGCALPPPDDVEEDAGSADASTQSPDSSVSSPDAEPTVPRSCREIRDGDASADSGQYVVDPDGAGTISPLMVYCEMVADGGGWTLLATLRSTTSNPSTSLWPDWSASWWTSSHGVPSDPNDDFSNQSMSNFSSLIHTGAILRFSSPANTSRRFQRGITQENWSTWGTTRNVDGVSVIGPFNLPDVVAATNLEFTGSVPATSNGGWLSGVFFVGSAPMPGGDADAEGINRRYHVGSLVEISQAGWVGDEREDSLWHIWLRE